MFPELATVEPGMEGVAESEAALRFWRVEPVEAFTVGGRMTLSARNHLKGTIEEIQLGDAVAHVTMRVGGNEIESVITRRSAEELSLKKGDVVTAVVKATEVMISKG